MTKQALTRQLATEGRKLFPRAEAILLWGGALRRDVLPPYGDVDVLIVLAPSTKFLSVDLISRLQEYKAILGHGGVDLDPFITNTTDLGKGSPRFAGLRGEYYPHGLICYQIKYESDTIWGNAGVVSLIKPLSLTAALNDMVPKVLVHGVRRIRSEFPLVEDRAAYIVENKNDLIVVARTIYTLREGELATKEEAIAYVKKAYPEVGMLPELLLELYTNTRTGSNYLPSIEEVEAFLVQGEVLITSFMAAQCP